MSDVNPSGKLPGRPAYYTWASGDEEGRRKAFARLGRALKNFRPRNHTRASDTFVGVAPNRVSVRDEFSREDWEDFRQNEVLPKSPREIIKAANSVYKRNPMVRSVFDIMTDFTSGGARPAHPDPAAQQYLREWWKLVDGPDRSERFTSNIYRKANVVINRQMGRGTSGALRGKQVPVRYSFYNVCSLDLLSEDLAPFLGRGAYLYGLRIPQRLRKILAEPKDAVERKLIELVPEDIRRAAKEGDLIPLDPENTLPFWYRKDDDEAWATPIAYSILPAIQQFEKNQLADLAALDGVISSIRLWRVGSLEHGLVPSEATLNRLADMLASNVGTGTVMDLIWTPDIELTETSTEAYKFLGEDKYKPCLRAIYAGLGIPPTLIGASEEGGFTNNFFSLRVMVERLKLGRELLDRFWLPELNQVCRAGGYAEEALMTYDRLITDEASEKALIRDLVDRDIISPETARDVMEFHDGLENARLRREGLRRKKGSVPPKASPYHTPQHRENMEKIFAQTGELAPSEFGIDLDKVRQGDEAPNERSAKRPQAAQTGPGGPPTPKKPKGQPGEGRPKNKKDTRKRRRRPPFPRTSASLQRLVHAKQTLAEVAGLVTPAYLNSLGKKSLRELTDSEAASFEDFKFSLLFSLKGEPTPESVKEVLRSSLPVPAWATTLLNRAKEAYLARGRKLTLDVLRDFQSSIFAAHLENAHESPPGGPEDVPAGDGVPAVSRAAAEPT